MGWLAYAAMAGALLPLLFMCIGYFYMAQKKRGGNEDAGENE